MQVAYHRRPALAEDDIAPMTLTQLGSGVNLLGYYMFHGGTNPQGKRTDTAGVAKPRITRTTSRSSRTIFRHRWANSDK